MKNSIEIIEQNFKMFEELERLGIKHQPTEKEDAIYLHIPRDLCKSHVQEYIDDFKGMGIKVFTRVMGVNDLFNCNGGLMERTTKLSKSEVLEYARGLLSSIKEGKEVEYAKNMFLKITDEESEEVKTCVQGLRMLDKLRK